MSQKPSGGIIGILKNLIVFFINYGYIPLQWLLTTSSKKKLPLEVSELNIRPNQLVILTGATGGLGSLLLKRLLDLDMHVVAGARNLKEVGNIVQEARYEDITTGKITILKLDLTLLESVRNFANEVLRMDAPIGVLINAAGIQGVPYEVTRDENEKQFQVNYLGHFLLTNLLIPKMSQVSSESEPTSIVNLSSVVQAYGKIDLDNLNSQKWYNAAQAYYNSKLYIIASSHFLGIRLKQNGLNVRVNSVHPGFLKTGQWDNYCCKMLRIIWKNTLPPPSTGVDDVLYVAFHPDTTTLTGMFYLNRKPDPAVPKQKWRLMEELWNTSCDLAKIENIYSIPGNNCQTTNREDALQDLDIIKTSKSNKPKQINRTLSVITINSSDAVRFEPSTSTLNTGFTNLPIKLAVAPLESGIEMTKLVLSSVTPVVGIISSTIDQVNPSVNV